MSQDQYFSHYEDLTVHEIMLRDRQRQNAYKSAIMSNAGLFKDKVVLDVGAGTGILSVFCAKAGAKLVYAVEASNLAEIALNVMRDNGLMDIVKVVQSKIEDFKMSSDDKVDIIVSEWMGFYLVHEGMLDSVIYARDRFLSNDGILFPNEATLFIAPTSLPMRFDDWDNYDGVRLSAFASMLRQQKSTTPEILSIPPQSLLHSGIPIFWMNLRDIRRRDLDRIEFQDVVATKSSGKHQGFCIWFDCRFPGSNYGDSITLSTNPEVDPTHWRQCVIALPDSACEDLDENSPIAFKIVLKRQTSNARKYNIEVELLDPNKVEHPLPCNCHYTKCILAKAHLFKSALMVE